MKNFQNYTPEKYAAPAYRLVEEGVYLTAKPKNMLFGFPYESKEHYVTAVCAVSSAGASTPRRSPTPAGTRRTGRWLSNNLNKNGKL